jgi:autotransporter-associated beta strand protein
MTVITDADGGDFRFGTSYAWSGWPNASLVLNGPVNAYYIGISSAGAGTIIPIGELTGTSNARLMGGVTGGRNFTYVIGGRTPLGSEATFAGTIAEQNTSVTTSFVKTGAGTWTLSGSCAWNGGTTVDAGTLKISGTVACGGATQVNPGATLTLAGGTLSTDTLRIAETATLNGRGTLQGDLNNLGTITCGAGTFTVTGELVNDGTLRVTGGAALNVAGRVVNNGVLDLLTAGSGAPANLVNNGVVISNGDRRILQATKSGSSFSCTVQGYAGHVYQLQRADGLTGPWTNVGAAQTGAGNLIVLSDNGGAAVLKRFYRVSVTP